MDPSFREQSLRQNLAGKSMHGIYGRRRFLDLYDHLVPTEIPNNRGDDLALVVPVKAETVPNRTLLRPSMVNDGQTRPVATIDRVVFQSVSANCSLQPLV
jgi:hypothetical protein